MKKALALIPRKMSLDLKFRGEHSNARGILNFRADGQIISGHITECLRKQISVKVH